MTWVGGLRSIAWRLSVGMGVGLSCGTFPSYIGRRVATDIGLIPARLNHHIFDRRTLKELMEETVIEELFFRGVIQGFVLTRIPECFVTRLGGNKGFIVHNSYVKTIRVLITSTVFSISHLPEEREIVTSSSKAQVLGSFIGGICLGCMKESRLGLSGAVGGHLANNFWVFYNPIGCTNPKTR